MKKGQSNYTNLAINCVESIANGNRYEGDDHDNYPLELQVQAACFVSIHRLDDSLRGCMGSIDPVEKFLYLEIIRNARLACSRDPRFEEVKAEELHDLQLSVDVLSQPELIDNIELLDPKKYGLILSKNQYERGVLLPNLEGVSSIEKQISIVKQKAGLNNYPLSELNMYRFTATRYF